MARSGPGERKNYYTCEFDEMALDFRDRPRSYRYLLAYGAADGGGGCGGAKFEGKYRAYLADGEEKI